MKFKLLKTVQEGRIEKLEAKIKEYRAAYIKLTNCDQYSEGGEIKGHYCPNKLLAEFDAIESK